MCSNFSVLFKIFNLFILFVLMFSSTKIILMTIAAAQLARQRYVCSTYLKRNWLKNGVLALTKHLHNNYWSNLKEYKQVKLTLSQLDPRLTRQFQLNKPSLHLMRIALTGHGCFNKHLFNLGAIDSLLCRERRTDETAAHILLEWVKGCSVS